MNKNGYYFKPEGLYAVMLTPFDETGRINELELRRYTRWLIAKGVDGLFPLGSLGEFIHLNFEEKVKVMEIVCDEAKEKVPVISGAIGSCASKCIELVKEASKIGCKSVVIAPPYYFPASQEIIEEHYIQIAKAMPDFPIMLYNIPSFCEHISYDVVKRLSRLPNIIGMKDSSGSMVDLLHYIDKIKIAGEDLCVLTGRDELIMTGLIVGASGTMTSIVGIAPEITIKLYEHCRNKEYVEANPIQLSILKLIRAMFAVSLPLGFKYAMEVRGFNMGQPKQPQSPADQYYCSGVKSRIQKLLVQLIGKDLL